MIYIENVVFSRKGNNRKKSWKQKKWSYSAPWMYRIMVVTNRNDI